MQESYKHSTCARIYELCQSRGRITAHGLASPP